MVSEHFDPRQQMVWSDSVGWYTPSRIPNPFRSLAPDRPYSFSGYGGAPADRPYSFSGYGGAPVDRPYSFSGYGGAPADRPYFLSGYGGGPNRSVVKVPGSTPGKIPNPSSDLGKMKKSVVRYEAEASDPTAVWRVVHLRPSEEPRKLPDRVPPAEWENEKTRRSGDLRWISLNSTQGTRLRNTSEGNFNSPPTGFSVVANGRGEDQLPHDFVASPTLNNLNPSHGPELARQCFQYPRKLAEMVHSGDLEIPEIKDYQLENGTVASKSEEVTDGIDCAVQGDFGIPSWLFGLSLPDAVEHAKDALSVMDKNVDSNEVGEIQKDVAEKTNFVMANVPDEAKLYLAQLYMVGRGDKLGSTGLLWKPPPWPDFCAMGCDSFAHYCGYEVIESFYSVKQYKLSISDYIDKFEELMAVYKNESPLQNPSFFVKCFINGLRSDIKNYLKPLKPQNLGEAYWMAKDTEKGASAAAEKDNPNAMGGQIKHFHQAMSTPAVEAAAQKKDTTLKPFTSGVCKYCRDKWFLGHKCRHYQQVNLMAGEDEETVPADTGQEKETDAEKPVSHSDTEEQLMQISLQAVGGMVGVSTYTFEVDIGGKKGMALVDSGSSHTFMDLIFATQTSCKVELAPLQKVAVAGGGVLLTGSYIQEADYSIRGENFSSSFKLLPLKGYELVFGCDWLYQHSPVSLELKTRRLTIKRNGIIETTLEDLQQDSLVRVINLKNWGLTACHIAIHQGTGHQTYAENSSHNSALNVSIEEINVAEYDGVAALSTFRRPECTVGREDGQQVTVHDLEEEAVMGERMTATTNSNGDICDIQQVGGEGVMSSVIMQCLRIASVKATDITSKTKNKESTHGALETETHKTYYEYTGLWHIYGLLSMNAWFWRAIYHSCDTFWTQKLYYSSVAAFIGYSLILAILRTLNLRDEASRVMVAAPILAFTTTHILYLNFYELDKDLNTKILFVTMGSVLSMILEAYDMPPRWGYVDGHAICLAMSTPVTYLWWRFAEEDAEMCTSAIIKKTRACVEECAKTGSLKETSVKHCQVPTDNRPVDKSWYAHEPLYLQWKEWNCKSECRYHCMMERESEKEQLGLGPVKYHGKWPLKRASVFQEPISAALSALALLVQFIGWLSFFLLLSYKLPLRPETHKPLNLGFLIPILEDKYVVEGKVMSEPAIAEELKWWLNSEDNASLRCRLIATDGQDVIFLHNLISTPLSTLECIYFVG